MEEINTTEDLGFTEIEIAKVGEYNGSDKDGNPIKENLTEESLKAIVEDVNNEGREILVDKQHNSMKQGLERDDSACGWLKALSFKNGSIFGKCFWTKLGRQLIDSRILRFISPVAVFSSTLFIVALGTTIYPITGVLLVISYSYIGSPSVV